MKSKKATNKPDPCDGNATASPAAEPPSPKMNTKRNIADSLAMPLGADIDFEPNKLRIAIRCVDFR